MQGDFRIGEWLVQPQLNQISGHGRSTRVEPKAMQVLVCLAENSDQVVSKGKLIRAVWADTFVTDDVLTRCISELRKAFDDDPRDAQVIETIPKGGYRLRPRVERVGADHVEPNLAGTPAKSPTKPVLVRRTAAATLSLVALLGTLFLLNGGGVRDRSHSSAATPPKPRRTILMVLPVTTPGGSPEMAKLAEGVTEEATASLGRLDSNLVGVIAATTARHYSADNASIARARKELGVDYVMEFSLQQSRNNLRLTVKVIRANDQTSVVSEPWDWPISDTATYLREIGRGTAYGLGDLFAPRSEADRRAQQANPDLFIAVTTAHVNCWTKEAAVAEFKAIIQTDPSYAHGYAGLATCYVALMNRKVMPGIVALGLAKENAQKALQLDPANSYAHRALAEARENEWDFVGAEQSYREALRHSPSDIEVRWPFIFFLSCMGRHGEAIQMAREAVATEPGHMGLLTVLAQALLHARRYEEAAQHARKAVATASNRGFNGILGMAYMGMGRNAEAVRELEEFIRLRPGSRNMRAELVRALAAAGRQREAIRMMRDIRDSHKTESGNAYNVATALCGLGEKEEAIKWLERAYAEHESDMMGLLVDPAWDILRADPRFQDLVRRMNFPK